MGSAIRVIAFLKSLLDVLISTPADGDVLTYEAATSLWKNKAASGGGSGGDMLSQLLYSEVSVTGATTLTIGKMHVCSDSGTPANYSATLPAASGNAGKFVGVRMASGLTKLVTLTGHSAELIDGSNTRVMWAQESAILLCDGTGWSKVSGKSIPFLAQLARAATQSIGGATVTKVLFDTLAFDSSGQVASVSNSKFTLLRPAKISISASWYSADSGSQSRIHVNSIELKTQVGTPLPIISDIFSLSSGDVVEFYVYTPSGGSTQTATPLQPRMTIGELPEW